MYDQEQTPPDVIKLDVEGGEGRVLLGMKRLLEQERPLILIELHGEKAANQVWKQLQTHKYKLHRMDHGYSLVKDIDNLNWKSYIVAVPSEMISRLN